MLRSGLAADAKERDLRAFGGGGGSGSFWTPVAKLSLVVTSKLCFEFAAAFEIGFEGEESNETGMLKVLSSFLR